MTGLELQHGDTVVSAEREDGVITIFLTAKEDSLNLTLREYDPQTEEHISHYIATPEPGDRIRIRVTDDRTIEEAKEDKIEILQAQYRTLKKELTEQGLI